MGDGVPTHSSFKNIPRDKPNQEGKKMATIKTFKHWRGNLMGRPLRLWEGGVNVIEKTVLSSDIHVLLQSS